MASKQRESRPGRIPLLPASLPHLRRRTAETREEQYRWQFSRWNLDKRKMKTHDWELYKDIIIQLYSTMSLSRVQKQMQMQYGFQAK